MFDFISSNHIINWGRAKEVLLLQSQFFSWISAVVWIKNTCDIFSILSFFNSALKITWIKFIKIESVSWSWSPQSQIICVVSIKSWNRCVISHSYNFLTVFPVRSFSWPILIFLRLTIKSNLISYILSFNFPWISLV
jgi:hypothetical protein